MRLSYLDNNKAKTILQKCREIYKDGRANLMIAVCGEDEAHKECASDPIV